MTTLAHFGPIVMTSGISEWIKESPDSEEVRYASIRQSLSRHLNGDWGNLDEDDQELNNEVFQSPGCDGRLVSRYNFPDFLRNTGMDNGIYIITSNFGIVSDDPDDNNTCILFPSEY